MIYSLKLVEKLNFLSLVDYAKEYVAWKSLSVTTADEDDDAISISGAELKDIERIHAFLKEQAVGKFFSIMYVVDLLHVASKYSPEKEGQAKNIFLSNI